MKTEQTEMQTEKAAEAEQQEAASVVETMFIIGERTPNEIIAVSLQDLMFKNPPEPIAQRKQIAFSFQTTKTEDDKTSTITIDLPEGFITAQFMVHTFEATTEDCNAWHERQREVMPITHLEPGPYQKTISIPYLAANTPPNFSPQERFSGCVEKGWYSCINKAQQDDLSSDDAATLLAGADASDTSQIDSSDDKQMFSLNGKLDKLSIFRGLSPKTLLMAYMPDQNATISVTATIGNCKAGTIQKILDSHKNQRFIHAGTIKGLGLAMLNYPIEDGTPVGSCQVTFPASEDPNATSCTVSHIHYERQSAAEAAAMLPSNAAAGGGAAADGDDASPAKRPCHAAGSNGAPEAVASGALLAPPAVAAPAVAAAPADNEQTFNAASAAPAAPGI
jgi:hypothetical protein